MSVVLAASHDRDIRKPSAVINLLRSDDIHIIDLMSKESSLEFLAGLLLGVAAKGKMS